VTAAQRFNGLLLDRMDETPATPMPEYGDQF
jgi:hypothetical protein